MLTVLEANITNPGVIFANWVPLTDGFGYSGQGNELRYTGRWLAPYSSDTLEQALNLIDFKGRFAAAANATNSTLSPDYLYKQQIEQTLLNNLTSQRMSIKPCNGYAPISVDENNMSTDGQWNGQANATNIIQNAYLATIDVEWMLKPINVFGLNCCYVSVQGTGEFNEMGSDRTCWVKQDTRTANGYPLDTPGKIGISVITANTPANNTEWLNPDWSYLPIQNLAKGYTLVEPKDTVTIEYPWVDASLVNLQAMRDLRGSINLNDVLQWPAGTLLYESSDVESALSPLGTPGFKVVHHFTARDVDWNLIPIIPPSVPIANATINTTWNQISFGWATYKPPLANYNQTNPDLQPSGVYPNLPEFNLYSYYQNRVYQYKKFYTNTTGEGSSVLFFYGFDPKALWYTPPVNPLFPT